MVAGGGLQDGGALQAHQRRPAERGRLPRPGVGGLLCTALAARDRSLVVGIVTFVAVLVIVANALADVVVAALDPRIRAG